MKKESTRSKRPYWILVLVMPILSACQSLSYYYQSASGQINLLKRAESIDELLIEDAVPSELKSRLSYIKRVRSFASSDLYLPDNNSYKRYADLKRNYAVWNVVAAEPLDFVGKHWCYPVIGCQLYKGFFAKEDAEKLAVTLSDEYDVATYGVKAYSTLGWFSDPVLNTFIDSNDAWVASLIFHELSHQIIYVENDTMFNESFASAVEEMGLIEWKRQADETIDLTYTRKHDEFTNTLLTTKKELAMVYAKKDLSDDEKKIEKARAFIEIRRDCLRIYSNKDYCARYEEPNNAWLLLAASYDGLKPQFIRLHQCVKGDWPKFYTMVKSLAQYEAEERISMLNALKTDCYAVINQLEESQ